jgi:TetR/AcrR family transcriptional regulator
LVISRVTARHAGGTVAGMKTKRAARVEKELAIVQEAEAQFARYGFEGATLESIGAALGISRHNLLYYFPSKEALYQRVLDDVMAQWLAGMSALAEPGPGDDVAAALRRYIAAKLKSSKQRRDGTGVFTKEVMAGAPRYGQAITTQVLPVLQADVRHFKRWAREGRVAPLNYTHLMFAIWAVTQAYADLAPQFALLLGKKALTQRDFAAAQDVIERMVLGALGLAAGAGGATRAQNAAAGRFAGA